MIPVFQSDFRNLCYTDPDERFHLDFHTAGGISSGTMPSISTQKDVMNIKQRHEWKHEINTSDLLVIRQRLRAVAQPDAHGPGGRYAIRSLYFDDPHDTALREKLDGVDRREKFRIRYYNGVPNPIHLEKKSKQSGLGTKVIAVLSVEEAQDIVDGRLDWMPYADQPLIRELYVKTRADGLRPQTIVDYTREAFVFAPGNVRVTLDYGLRTSLNCTGFLNPACVTIPAGNAPIILEVKWDEFLPSIIRDAVQLPNRHTSSFSKYAACRVYD